MKTVELIEITAEPIKPTTAGFNTTVFTDISFYTTLIIFLISVVLAFKKLNPILIICLSAILGIVCGYI